MTDIPYQRSYETVPTPELEHALELNADTYYNLLDQIEAVQVTRAAIRNVLMQRRHTGGERVEGVA